MLLLLVTFNSSSQIIGYADSALLFSKDNTKGTARFTAMSGAFGALGGNLSAVDVNPAGLSIFKYSEATLTLGNRKTESNSNYYNTSTLSSNNIFNFSQAGAVFVLKNNADYWNKFAVSINFTTINDFENSYLTKGNSGLSEFFVDPFLNFDNDDTNDVFYENVTSQEFLNITDGSNNRVTFTLAGQYDQNTSFGFSIISHSLDFFQNIIFLEENTDDENNTLKAKLDQRLVTVGEGIGFNFGVISKPTPYLRLGLAYQTPIWYDLNEEFQEDTIINLSNTNDVYTEFNEVNIFDYSMTTPSKLTGSIAYLFGKKGLISADYIYKDYNNIKLKPTSEFDIENQNVKNNLTGASQLRIGAEYRFESLSVRTGFHFEENPIDNSNLDNTNGYSLGLGFKFSNRTKLDLSYDNTSLKENYNFLNMANPTNVDITNERIIATLTIGI